MNSSVFMQHHLLFDSNFSMMFGMHHASLSYHRLSVTNKINSQLFIYFFPIWTTVDKRYYCLGNNRKLNSTYFGIYSFLKYVFSDSFSLVF